MPGRIVVVNPRAGGGRAAAAWRAIVARDPSLSAIEAETPEDARRKLAVAVLEREVESVVAVGGDGTVHSVANFLLDHSLAGRVTLGIVPAGTGSDLARTLGVPLDPAAAWERHSEGVPRPLDAIRLETPTESRWVVNVSSFGLSGLVGERVNALEERGQWVYIRETVAVIRRGNPVACSVRIDGQSWFEGPVLLVAVANGSEFGKGMKIAPQARPDDGLLDVVVVAAMPRWLQLARLPRILRGTHLSLRDVHYRRARRVDIVPLGDSPPYELDGELLTSGPATFEVVPRALTVVV